MKSIRASQKCVHFNAVQGYFDSSLFFSCRKILKMRAETIENENQVSKLICPIQIIVKLILTVAIITTVKDYLLLIFLTV